MVEENKKSMPEDFYMTFNQREEKQVDADAGKKLWRIVADMITGPEHEYVCLKKLIARYKF